MLLPDLVLVLKQDDFQFVALENDSLNSIDTHV
jgi:hypothetical protein